jgi:hypothetical protein
LAVIAQRRQHLETFSQARNKREHFTQPAFLLRQLKETDSLQPPQPLEQ